MSFDANEFLQSELSLEKVNALIKSEVVDLAKLLKIKFDSKAKKAVIRELLVTELVNIEKLPESAIETLQITVQATLELEKYKLHIKERELELKYQGEREERVQAKGVRATECPITSRKVSQTICEY